MKHFYIFLFCLSSIFFSAQVQDGDSLKRKARKDTLWKFPGLFNINASQTSLSNWQGGGQDNVTIMSLFKLEPTFRKDSNEWISKIDLQYGLMKPGSSVYRKNADQLFLLTKYSIKGFNKHWYYTTQADFRTQFSPGYNYNNDSIVGRATSDFLSPGYIQLALGLDFKVKDYFTITFAPAAGKVTVVTRQYLADAGAYGVEKAVTDSAGNIITPGKNVRYEFGGRIIIKFKKEIYKNVTVDSYLDFFSNYAHNPQNIDVVMNNTLTFKISRYFNVNIISQILYDDDIIVKRDWDKDGLYNKPQDINGPRLQLLTTVAFGFGIKF